jgi:DNA topoisomerase-2
MAQNFVGSNNLPYFERKGEFGTRSKLGGDAAAGRYIHTKPEFWISTVFRKEDIPILDILIEEGEHIEPRTLLPILPMHLINGQIGIGTGSSTWIPPHDPLQIVYWLESRLQNLPLPELTPWYRGFTGEIEIIKRDPKVKNNENSSTEYESESGEGSHSFEEGDNEAEGLDEPDEVMVNKKTRISMVTRGILEETGRNKLLITELPIGRSIHSYKVFLDKMREKKLITNYKNYSTPEVPKFEITGSKTSSMRTLKLVKTYGMSNMVLLDDQNRPVKYKNSQDIMETFYHIRLAYYQKRKDYMISEMERDIRDKSERIKFILSVIKGYHLAENGIKTVEEANAEGGILVVGKNKAAIIAQAKVLNLDAELVKKVTLHQCTKEEVDSLKDDIEKLKIRLEEKRKQSCQSMWLDDLEDFTKVYSKYFKEKYTRPSP